MTKLAKIEEMEAALKKKLEPLYQSVGVINYKLECLAADKKKYLEEIKKTSGAETAGQSK